MHRQRTISGNEITVFSYRISNSVFTLVDRIGLVVHATLEIRA